MSIREFPFLGSDARESTVRECESGDSVVSTGAMEDTRREEKLDGNPADGSHQEKSKNGNKDGHDDDGDDDDGEEEEEDEEEDEDEEEQVAEKDAEI